MELCIDTSTRYASVAVSMDGAIAAQLSWRSARNHSVELVDALRLVMERTGAAMDDLDAVFVARGPGGFSALRVGLSFAKSLAMATGAPLVGVGTLDAEALPYLEAGRPICAAIEAGRRALYVGLYGQQSSGGAGEAGYRVVGWEELSTVIEDGALVCGESAAAVARALAEQGHRANARRRGAAADQKSRRRRGIGIQKTDYRRRRLARRAGAAVHAGLSGPARREGPRGVDIEELTWREPWCY